MDEIKVEQLIVSTKSRRGDGKETPIRVITEVYQFDGRFVASNDCLSFSIEQINEFISTISGNVDNREIQKLAKLYFTSNKNN